MTETMWSRVHMRSLPLLIVPFLVWLSGVPAVVDVGSEWRSNGPDGGSVYALAVDPQESAVVYAGTGNGVFKSENGGISWDNASSGLTNRDVAGLAIDPQQPATL